jgi:hypothetical protein
MRGASNQLSATLSVRFWIEIVAGALSAASFALTFIAPQWIETVFGADLDRSSGEAEWVITAGLCAFAIFMLAAAHREWKRALIANQVG